MLDIHTEEDLQALLENISGTNDDTLTADETDIETVTGNILTTTETAISTSIHTDTEIGNTVTESASGHTERVRKRACSGSLIQETQEVDFTSEISNSNIVRARKRALSD